MKTWILSSDSEIPSTKRLVQALKKSKFETEVLNPLKLQFEFGRKGPRIFHSGESLNLPDLVLPRLGWETLSFGLRLARFLECTGVRVINSAQSCSQASDKLLSLQIFFQHKLPIPQTRFAEATADTSLHLFPKEKAHVFKTLQGSQGFGVTWQLDRRQSQAQIDTFRTLGTSPLVQELIEESFGEDVRAFVIDGQVVAAMKRRGPKQDLRSNLHQDGKARSTRLTAEEASLVVKACESLGLFYAGVDFLRTSRGALLLEANPSPGFEGIYQATGKDLATDFAQALRCGI